MRSKVSQSRGGRWQIDFRIQFEVMGGAVHHIFGPRVAFPVEECFGDLFEKCLVHKAAYEARWPSSAVQEPTVPFQVAFQSVWLFRFLKEKAGFVLTLGSQ